MATQVKSCKLVSFILLSLGVFFASTALAQDENFGELAKKVIHTSANVKAGDVVVIYGGKHTIPLMELLAIEANKAGGMTNMFLDSDRVLRSYYSEVDDKYLEQIPTFFAEWLKHIDVWIELPGTEDPKAVYGDIPEDRAAKAAKSWEFIQEKLNEMPIRGISINYPTKQSAAIYQLDFSTYEKMHWEAVNLDYKKISETGNAIKKIIQSAKSIKVNSPAGTNFTFDVGDRPIFIDDCIITEDEAKENLFFSRWASLPGGYLFFAPIETSLRHLRMAK